MPARIPHEEPRNPLWMFTFGDLSLLLLVFFILFFALMSLDRTRFARLQLDLERAAAPGRAEGPGADRGGPPEAGPLPVRAMLERPEEAARGYRVGGLHAEVRHLPEATVLILAGEEGSFPEADWRLGAAQKRVLVEFKRWMAGRKNVVEIRGHTAANLQDSVVMDAGDRIRPFSTADLERPDRHSAANHSLLAWLRAHEVLRFLASEHPDLGDAVRIPEDRLRARADGYTRAVADSLDPALRVRNRRIEVVVTSELRER